MEYKKKVLIINTVPFSVNGISSVILNHYNITNKEIEYFFIGNEFISEQFQESINNKSIIRILPSRKKNLVNYMMQLSCFLKNNHFDAIHIHGNSYTMIIEVMIAKLCSFKGIIIIHTHNDIKNKSIVSFILTKLLLKLSDKLVACGNDAGYALYNKKKFIVINNGINVENFHFNSIDREQLRIGYNLNQKIVLGHVGLFNEQKNQVFLIDFMKYLEKNKLVDRFHLILIGEGDKKNSISKSVNESKINVNVTILPNQNDISKYYSSMDFLVMPSIHEGMPLVAIEAQSNGLPVVISNKVDKKININGNVFFLEIDSNETTFKKWLELIIKNKKIASERIALGKYMSETNFNIRNLKNQILNLYSLD